MRGVTRWRLVLAVLALSACGGGAKGDVDGAADCAPSTTGRIVARGSAFDKDCLAAPAGAPFTITLDNTDSGIQHNLAIYEEHPTSGTQAKVLFRGDLVTGPKEQTYAVGSLPAGSYHFQCEVHASMDGTFRAT